MEPKNINDTRSQPWKVLYTSNGANGSDSKHVKEGKATQLFKGVKGAEFVNYDGENETG